MEITIPTHISGLRIKHADIFNYIKENEITSIEDKAKVISSVTGIDSDFILKHSIKDLRFVFSKIMECLNTYKQKEIPLELKLGGKEFELVDKFSKLPVGWFIDADSVDMENHPELLPAFCYLEKGMKYAEKDDHKNIINPLKDRAELFDKEMPLDLFLDVSAFFLSKHKQYKSSFMEIQKLRQEKIEKDLRLNGKQ